MESRIESMKARATAVRLPSAPGNSNLVGPEGQVCQQLANLDAVQNDTQDIINALYVKLKPVMHSSESEASGIDGEPKGDIVPLADNLQNIYSVAASQRTQLQYLLKRIDI